MNIRISATCYGDVAVVSEKHDGLCDVLVKLLCHKSLRVVQPALRAVGIIVCQNDSDVLYCTLQYAFYHGLIYIYILF